MIRGYTLPRWSTWPTGRWLDGHWAGTWRSKTPFTGRGWMRGGTGTSYRGSCSTPTAACSMQPVKWQIFFFSAVSWSNPWAARETGGAPPRWHNAVAESFFKTVKCELIHLRKWTSYEETFKALNSYIHWYNTKRIHQGLGYLTPLEKEKQLRNMLHKKAAWICTKFCRNISTGIGPL